MVYYGRHVNFHVYVIAYLWTTSLELMVSLLLAYEYFSPDDFIPHHQCLGLTFGLFVDIVLCYYTDGQLSFRCVFCKLRHLSYSTWE